MTGKSTSSTCTSISSLSSAFPPFSAGTIIGELRWVGRVFGLERPNLCKKGREFKGLSGT